jgi:hypothetical protein
MAINSTEQTKRYIGFGLNENKPTSEFYPSPRIAVTKLLDYMDFGEVIAEPACGNGAISSILEEYGYQVHSTDLNDWGYGVPGNDFLTTSYYDDLKLDAVITNPPFNIPRGISGKFVERGLELTKNTNGKVAILQKLTFLEGVTRNKLFKELPFSKCLVFSARLPRMHRFDYEGKKETSMIAFAWFIWSHTHKGPPIIDWL